MKTLALALALSLVPALASAQTPRAPAPAARRHVVYGGPIMPIEGRVAHPYYWVHTRSQLHYAPADPRRTLAPSVVREVRRAPF